MYKSSNSFIFLTPRQFTYHSQIYGLCLFFSNIFLFILLCLKKCLDTLSIQLLLFSPCIHFSINFQLSLTLIIQSIDIEKFLFLCNFLANIIFFLLVKPSLNIDILKIYCINCIQSKNQYIDF